MNNSSKIIDLAMNVFVLAAVISFVVFLAMLGYNAFFKINEPLISKVSRDASEEWKQYDRTVVMGDTVRYLLDKYSEDAFIRVATQRQPYGFYGDVDTVNPDSACFVDMSAEFLASEVYDETGIPVGLSIVQLSVLNTSLNSARYSAILDREIAAYRELTAEVQEETNTLVLSNGGNYYDFSQEARVACRKYYFTQVKSRLCRKIIEVLS